MDGEEMPPAPMPEMDDAARNARGFRTIRASFVR